MTKLLNYTTSVSAERTVAEVHKILVSAGATQIGSEYAGGRPTGVAFIIETLFGSRRYRLPVHATMVEKVLARQKVERRYQTPEHAEKVAWRILKDWLEAQLAIIQTEMVTLDQVMLPYMTNDEGQTVYEIYANNQLALPAPER